MYDPHASWRAAAIRSARGHIVAVRYDGNVITLSGDLSHPAQADYFIQGCHQVIRRRGWSEVLIRFDSVGRRFPNVTAPIAAVVEHHRSRGVQFDVEGGWEGTRERTCIDPVDAGAELDTGTGVLSRVWRFDERSAHPLADRIVYELLDQMSLSEGVHPAFNWCLWEVMDNVLQHSRAECGFVEAQTHPRAQNLAVCVADAGVGILESFSGSRHRPGNAVDAITLAIQENVTRDANIGQGNGLRGLYQIVAQNDGRLRISSGRGVLDVHGAETPDTNMDSWEIDRQWVGTTVDFQLSTAHPIDVSSALGHQPVNVLMESFESDNGEVRLVVTQEAHGLGTRRAAAALRNRVINVLRETRGGVVIDFDGVPLVSSSFADEFVARMVADLGFVTFQQAVRLQNMSELVQKMVNRAVMLRMAQLNEPDADLPDG